MIILILFYIRFTLVFVFVVVAGLGGAWSCPRRLDEGDHEHQ